MPTILDGTISINPQIRPTELGTNTIPILQTRNQPGFDKLTYQI